MTTENVTQAGPNGATQASEEPSGLADTLGRAGSAVGGTLDRARRSVSGDGSGEGSSAPRRVGTVVASVAVGAAGRALLARPRRRVAGVPIPGTHTEPRIVSGARKLIPKI
jgi:hypothetical protein